MPVRLTEDVIDRRIAQRRGTGELGAYKAWITIHDMASTGVTSQIPWHVTGRMHLVLSRNEFGAFHLLVWQDDVIDVREQFPLLPRDETIAIAASLGVRHPTAPGGVLFVMTTDFLVTRRNADGTRLEAISVKRSSSLSNERTLQKAEIERRYWEARGVHWYIVTECELPKVVIDNLRGFIPYRDLIDPQLSIAATDLIPVLYERIAGQPRLALFEVCAAADRDYRLSPGSCLTICRHALARKLWHVPLDLPFNPRNPVSGLRIEASSYGR